MEFDDELYDALDALIEAVGVEATAAFDAAAYAAAWDTMAGNAGHPTAGQVVVVDDDE